MPMCTQPPTHPKLPSRKKTPKNKISSRKSQPSGIIAKHRAHTPQSTPYPFTLPFTDQKPCALPKAAGLKLLLASNIFCLKGVTAVACLSSRSNRPLLICFGGHVFWMMFSGWR